MSNVLRHNARTLHFGPESLTKERAAEAGDVFIRHPKTGHGTLTTPASLRRMREKGHPMPGDPGPHEQQSMFSEGEVKNPPHHALSPHQFAAQHDVWWHGRYGEDIPSDSYKEGHEHFPEGEGHFSHDDEDDEDYDEKSGYQGIHFGTRKAAEERLTRLGPGRQIDPDASWPPPQIKNSERVPGRFFPVTLNKENMGDRVHSDSGHDWREHMGFDEPADEGVLYENQVEDSGAISAAVPERSGRSGHFFKTWNDHVTEAHDAGAEVHPMLLDYARKAPEHTGEDFAHPDEAKTAARHADAYGSGHEDGQLRLFHPYGINPSTNSPKYLDMYGKNTLSTIKVGKGKS